MVCTNCKTNKLYPKLIFLNELIVLLHNNLLTLTYRLLILWGFYIAENPEPTETEPVPVERLEGFIICKSLGYQDEVIKKAYLANDSKVLLFFLFIFDFYFVQCQGATVTA